MQTFLFDQYRKIAAEAGDKSLRQISARTGIDPGSLSRVLRGQRQPNLWTAKRLADAYDADIDDLVGQQAA